MGKDMYRKLRRQAKEVLVEKVPDVAPSQPPPPSPPVPAVKKPKLRRYRARYERERKVRRFYQRLSHYVASANKEKEGEV